MKIFALTKMLLVTFVVILVATACSQDEGVGGNSHIRGKLMVNYYNDDFSQLLSSEPLPAQDEDLFLIFGEDSVVGEKTSTSYTGDFEFEYLWPGNYKLFYYSEDTLPSLSNKIDTKIVREITLAKNETKILNDLVIYKSLEWNEGTSTISGTVYLINYKNSGEDVKYIVPAQEQEIYITYGNHKFYDERIRTSSDGTFVFKNLIKGSYRIFMYSEDITEKTAYNVVEKTIEITEDNQDINIEDIFYVEKL